MVQGPFVRTQFFLVLFTLLTATTSDRRELGIPKKEWPTGSQHNSDFFRLLMACAAFGPLCLVNVNLESPLGNSRGLNLRDLLLATLLPPVTHPVKVELERRMWNLIVRAATVNGGASIEEELKTLTADLLPKIEALKKALGSLEYLTSNPAAISDAKCVKVAFSVFFAAKKSLTAGSYTAAAVVAYLPPVGQGDMVIIDPSPPPSPPCQSARQRNPPPVPSKSSDIERKETIKKRAKKYPQLPKPKPSASATAPRSKQGANGKEIHEKKEVIPSMPDAVVNEKPLVLTSHYKAVENTVLVERTEDVKLLWYRAMVRYFLSAPEIRCPFSPFFRTPNCPSSFTYTNTATRVCGRQTHHMWSCQNKTGTPRATRTKTLPSGWVPLLFG